MPTQQPAAPSASTPKPSRSLSGSLCDLFSNSDSGSGMKAELSPRPGVSEGACRLSNATQDCQLHSALSPIPFSYFSIKPRDFYRA